MQTSSIIIRISIAILISLLPKKYDQLKKFILLTFLYFSNSNIEYKFLSIDNAIALFAVISIYILNTKMPSITLLACGSMAFLSMCDDLVVGLYPLRLVLFMVILLQFSSDRELITRYMYSFLSTHLIFELISLMYDKNQAVLYAVLLAVFIKGSDFVQSFFAAERDFVPLFSH